MVDGKIKCEKCGAKFIILGREKIICTQCQHEIIIKKSTEESPPEMETENLEELEDVEDLNDL